MQQQQKQIEEAVEKAQWDTVLKQSEENGLRLTDFDTILQPIIESCTKDSISAGMIRQIQFNLSISSEKTHSNFRKKLDSAAYC